MSQITLRVSDEVAADLKAAARAEGKSLNAWATHVLQSATDPTYGGDEGQRVRERLARAGLLVSRDELLAAMGPSRPRPSPEEFARARAEAGRGKLLSDIISEDRG